MMRRPIGCSNARCAVRGTFEHVVAFIGRGEYDKAREDVQWAESLGSEIHPEFLEELREVSKREK